MFHEDDGSVDVELLAECGAIAQRLRSLERSWSIELKDLQRKSLWSYGKPPLPSSHSITQKLNEIFDFTEADVALVSSLKDNHKGDDPEFASRLRNLEDIVIKIHCQQELQKRATTRKVHIKSNMNYSAATKHNNNDLMTSPTGVRDDQQPHSCSSSRDNINKSFTNDSADNDGGEAQNELSQENCSSNKQIIYHQQQLQLCSHITSDDLKLLLRELKRKVDFTEKMNWLCKLTRLRRTLIAGPEARFMILGWDNLMSH